MKLNLEYSVEDRRWYNYIGRESLEKHIECLLVSVFKVLKIKTNVQIELSAIFSNDKNMQKMNKKFRNKDAPTNVLSFPLYEEEFFEVIKKEKYVALGDIVLAFETVLREAGEQNLTFDRHLNHLITHSILHLIGFDHKKDNEAEEMERLEEEILRDYGEVVLKNL
jgi:probable rRNA maturation factor